ncbi:MAG: hypothetical protein M1814_000877 [Vezdaea aestivalis]|nr:MAG: hypothetical protein M1814_000877 [Vezdaea aestivalis]
MADPVVSANSNGNGPSQATPVNGSSKRSKPTKLAKRRPSSPPSPASRWLRKNNDKRRGSDKKDDSNGALLRKKLDAPAVVVDSDPATAMIPPSHNGPNGTTPTQNGLSSSDSTEAKFKISTAIPKSASLLDLDSFDELSFSKRGSILLGGKRGVHRPRPGKSSLTHKPSPPLSPIKSPPTPELQPLITLHTLSAEDEAASNRVRFMYEYGDPDGPSLATTRLSLVPDAPTPPASSHSIAISSDSDSGTPNDAMRRLQGSSGPPDSLSPTLRAPSALSTRSHLRSARRESMIIREEDELAGGIEDWAALNSADVDRYGFISPLRQVSFAQSSPASSPDPTSTSPKPPSNRTSTLLSAPNSRRPSRKPSTRSLQPPASILSSTSSKSARPALLPTSKAKRTLASASDMLTPLPGMADETARQDASRAAARTAKETQRGDKWRKMARAVNGIQAGAPPSSSGQVGGGGGGGMEFDFDPANAKVISRTWKGIPDRWRASAWWSFLRRSALRAPQISSPTTLDLDPTALIDHFFTLVDTPCVDDMQIDLDVPRTVAGHVMFRRRYRGGQRLLFRVLHCLSLAFPDVGYVQGMAGVAATLLCYYEEERAFVMAVWLWRCRGVEALYEDGFGGLMSALERFGELDVKRGRGGVVAKLTDLGIPPTTYGTRWYLTLFNYSIPFAAQLRVWDLLMLYDTRPLSKPAPNQKDDTTIDLLHAVSAALLDGLADVLAGADFEQAMHVLTSFVPVGDEDLLVRVVGVEWKRLGMGVSNGKGRG